MITKRTGNGQTECIRCKEKGKFALNWDSFLYTFNGKPYCFECLMEMLEEKDNIIKEAREYINTWMYNEYELSIPIKDKPNFCNGNVDEIVDKLKEILDKGE